MANDSTAALVVALSAQVTKFEKDMDQAVAIANRKTKEIETTFSKMNSSITNELSGFSQGIASKLGGIGTILTSLGPAGLAVAVALGTLAAGFVFLTDKVDKFAEKSKQLKEAAEVAGLTVNQFRALSNVGKSVGVDFEETERFVNRLTLAIQDLRTKGQGPLFDALLKVKPELIAQIAGAKDSAEAITILSTAVRGLNDQLDKNQIASAIGGKRNFSAGVRLLEAIPPGGIDELVSGFKEAGKAVDVELNERVVKLRREIEEIKRQTDTIWGRAFSVEVLEAQKKSAEYFLKIAQEAEKAKGGVAGFWDSVLRGIEKARQAGLGPQALVAVPVKPVTEGGPLPAATDPEIERRKQILASELELQNRRIQVLGDAATQTDLYKQKQLQLAVALNENKDITNEATRAQTYFNAQQLLAVEAVRERLGIADEQQIKEAKLLQLKLDAAKLQLTENEVLKATNVILLESKQTADALTVRQAYLPGLKQLELDAASVRKGLDQLATNSLNTLTDGFADIILHTKTLSEAFKQMTDSILRDIVRLVLRQAVVAPLAGSIQSLFGATGTIALPGRQSGGPVIAGHPYVVGERGIELFVPETSGHIVPNSVSSGRVAGGSIVEINNYVSADTETRQTTRQDPNSGERVIVDIVRRAQARGDFDNVNRGRFGIRPNKIR